MQTKQTKLNATVPVNGIDLDGLHTVMRDIQRDPAMGMVEFRVTSQWQGQARSCAKVESYSIGGRRETDAGGAPATPTMLMRLKEGNLMKSIV